jgi:hypothetical protein
MDQAMVLPRQSVSFPGSVYAVGSDSEAAAQAYARLTGRKFVSIAKAHDRVPAGRHDVVVCTTSHLTPGMMHSLYVEGDHDGAPGLICGASSTQLQRTCMKLFARIAQENTRPLRRIFLYPLLNFQAEEKRFGLFIGGAAQRETLIDALSAEASILSISTYGGGIDFVLSHQYFACPYSQRLTAGETLPVCQALDRCWRLSSSIATVEHAWSSGSLVPLTVLKAEVITLFGCSTVRFRDGVIDPAYTMTPALFDQADFTTLITTWRQEYLSSNGAYANGLINELSKGTMAGIAVARFNQSDYARRTGLNLCVLGDPCFRLSPSSSFEMLPEPVTARPQKSNESVQRESSGNVRVDILLEAASEALRNGWIYYKAHKAKILSDKLLAYSRCDKQAPLSAEDQAADVDLALLDFLAPVPWFERFRPVYRIEEVREDVKCPVCLAPARILYLSFPQYKGASWRVFICACCGECMLPAEWKVVLDLGRVDQRLVFVSGIPAGAKVLFTINDFYGWQDPVCTEYGKTETAAGLYEFRIPLELPPLPLRCNILIAHQLEFGHVGFGFVRLSTGQISTVTQAGC